MQLTKDKIKTYLIDVLGYSYNELSDLTYQELLDLAPSKQDVQEFCFG